jgi:hypothetical protein
MLPTASAGVFGRDLALCCSGTRTWSQRTRYIRPNCRTGGRYRSGWRMLLLTCVPLRIQGSSSGIFLMGSLSPAQCITTHTHGSSQQYCLLDAMYADLTQSANR